MASDPLIVSSQISLSAPSLPAGVWRASEQAIAPLQTCRTGHSALDACLPGAGWPIGCLIEILADAPGCGEIGLVAPALAALPTHRPIVLLNPPGVPNALAWQQWQIASQRLWWLHPKTLPDAWWSAETVLRGRAFAALLAWADPLDDKTLRRLHACAQDTSTVIFMFRPKSVARQFSPSPLRLVLTPDDTDTLNIEILKCKGNRPAAPITLIRKSGIPLLVGDTYVDGHRTLAVAS
ncbi:MAG: translesion DNA synthesis-associated protein ImuA [Burkholderiaceae bacterium]|nr:translesion DNA synthesis-associated protein ImuA [Burkholderiaceae bacterium]MCD8518036.1 translesion DNA synthesis-associated protein ImuA [Burkholderiaceae bacterium]MCD8564360.1 translesion DNA synthesis-associated protein ImuA [Burkholderiaceae bacterium]